MKRSAKVIGIAMLVLCVFLMFATGCSKKVVSKEEGPGVGVKKEDKAAELTAEEARQEALRRDAAAAAAAAAAEAAERAAKMQFDDIRFAFDKSAIEPAARGTLAKVGDWMMKNRNYALVIEGHCDERGTVEYNLALGQRRADAAMKYLVDLGVGKADITTVSFGKERPLDPAQNEEAWAKNRRAHFVVKAKK